MSANVKSGSVTRSFNLLSRACSWAALLLLGLHAPNAWGETFPSRSIEIIVPFPAGGSADVLTRVMAKQMGEILGQPMVVSNTSGANGAVGTERVARQPANGYTLGAATSTHPTLPFLIQSFTLDPIKDFTPICLYGDGPIVALVNPTMPVKNISDLIAYAKANPGKVNYAVHSGQVELDEGYLAKMAGVDMVPIPYKGGQQAAIAVITNESQLMMVGLAAARPFMDSGQLRAIGISSGRSYPGLIDLPEIGKTGLPGYEGSSAWVGLMGPAGLSSEIREKLSSACETSLRSEETTKAMAQFGMLPGSGKPEQLESLIRSDFSLLKRQVEFTGIRPK